MQEGTELGTQVVMEYLKLAYGQTRSEQTAKFKGTKDENGGRFKTSTQEFHFNYIIPWQLVLQKCSLSFFSFVCSNKHTFTKQLPSL